MTNIAYLKGYDSVVFNTRSRSFEPIGQRNGPSLRRSRIHANKILPTVQNRLARLCKNPPKYEVRPESNGVDDKDAARLSKQILEALWERQHLNKKRIELYMWMQQCGHAYVKVSWDPTLGKTIGEDGTKEGDVRIEVVNALEVFPDSEAKSFEEALETKISQAKVRKLDYFKQYYPEFGSLVTPESAWLLSNQYEQRINSMNNRGTNQANEEAKNSAVELITYEAPSHKYPEGRQIVSASGVFLEEKPLPVGEIPFAKFDDILIAGSYYSEAIITHLRPIQDQFNETIRRRAAWTNKLLAGKWHAFKNTGLAQESLNDESGEVLLSDFIPGSPDGGRPTPITVPNIPQWAYNEEDRLNQIFNDISGISDVSRGVLPSASIPAKGMEILQEADETRIGVMTELIEHSWARVGTLGLKYVEKFWVTPRKIKVAGKRFQYMVQEVDGSMLNGNTDVYVVRGSTVPSSLVLERENILNVYREGLLGDPSDPKVKENVLGSIEFGTTQDLWEDYGIDMSQIKRGMGLLEQGQPVDVSEFDNHAMWIQELNRYRKGDKFPSLDPAIQQLIVGTIEAHVQALVQLSNASPDLPPPPPPMMNPNEPPQPDPAMGPQAAA